MKHGRKIELAATLGLSAIWIASTMVVAGCGVTASRRNQLDLNSASEQELSGVAGLSPDDASRIVVNRPYYHRRDLVERHILTEAQFEQVHEMFYLGPPAVPSYLRWVAPIP